MKKFKRRSIKLLKAMIFIFTLFVVSISGLILYIKMSPKLEIKSANAFLMYDNNSELKRK